MYDGHYTQWSRLKYLLSVGYHVEETLHNINSRRFDQHTEYTALYITMREYQSNPICQVKQILISPRTELNVFEKYLFFSGVELYHQVPLRHTAPIGPQNPKVPQNTHWGSKYSPCHRRFIGLFSIYLPSK